MDAAARPSGYVAEAVVLAALGALLVAAVFAGGGSRGSALATVGLARARRRRDRRRRPLSGASSRSRGWIGRARSRSSPRPRSSPGRASRRPGRSRATARGSGSGAGSSTSRSSRSGCSPGRSSAGARRVAAVMAVVLGAALGWALLGVAIPSLFEDGDRIARLREPVGYWNALALLADGALAIGLWLVRDPTRPGSRRRSAPRLRGGARAAPHPVAVGRRRRSPRPRPLARALGQEARGRVPPRAPRRPGARRRRLGVHASGARRGRGAPRRPGRRRPGLRDPRPDRRCPRASRDSGSFPSGASCRSGGGRFARLLRSSPWEARSPGRPASSPRSAIRSTGCRHRFGAASARTTPAGSPTSARTTGSPGGTRRSRSPRTGRSAGRAPGRSRSRAGRSGTMRRPEASRTASRCSSSPTPASSGSASGCSSPAAAVVGVRRGLRLVPPDERAPAVALACLVLAYGVHSLVDYDLDFLAVTGPALAALGVLLAVGRPRAALHARLPGQLAVVAVAAAAALVLVLPAAADRRVEQSLDAPVTPAGSTRRSPRPSAPGSSTRSRSQRSTRSRPLRTQRATATRPSRGTRRRRASSPRTRTSGTRSASTTRSRPTTSAPRTRRSTGRTRSTRTARAGWRAACSTSPGTRSTPGRASGSRAIRRGCTRRARRGAAPGRIPSSGLTSWIAEVACEPPRLALESAPVHDERPRVVVPRGVADDADPVPAAGDTCGSCGGGALAAVAVEHDDAHLAPRQLGRGRLGGARLHRCLRRTRRGGGLRLRRGAPPRGLRLREQRAADDDEQDELDGRDGGDQNGCRPPRADGELDAIETNRMIHDANPFARVRLIPPGSTPTSL